MFSDVEVFIEFCRASAIMPEYSRPGDAGMDICAAEEVVIRPGETAIVPTGIKLAIPVGYEIQVRPRSGISYKTPLRISNSPGTIDSGFRDELGILVTNTSPICCSSEEIQLAEAMGGYRTGTYRICRGDKIAQIVLKEVPRMKFTVVDSVMKIGVNRGGGFGSTGLRENGSQT